LCPITFLGNLPVCTRFKVNSLQLLFTVMAFWSNCIESVLFNVKAHSSAWTNGAPAINSADNAKADFFIRSLVSLMSDVNIGVSECETDCGIGLFKLKPNQARSIKRPLLYPKYTAHSSY